MNPFRHMLPFIAIIAVLCGYAGMALRSMRPKQDSASSAKDTELFASEERIFQEAEARLRVSSPDFSARFVALHREAENARASARSYRENQDATWISASFGSILFGSILLLCMHEYRADSARETDIQKAIDNAASRVPARRIAAGTPPDPASAVATH